MRSKTNLLALGIIVVLIGVLFLAWSIVSKPQRGQIDVDEEVAKPEEASQPLEGTAELETTSARSRSEAAADREGERTLAASVKSRLRIQVRYASGVDEEAAGLEVGISNRLGELFQPQHVAPNEYVLAAAVPNVYIVRASARGFRAAVTHARHLTQQAETNVEITLVPERNVLVRWRSDDRRPIKVSIADATQFTGSVRLEVYATKFRTTDAPPLDRFALGVLRSEIYIDDSEHGARVAHEKRIDWVMPEQIQATDKFGTLTIAEDGVVFAGAFCNGVCVASLPIEPQQTEVDFVTPLADLHGPGGAVKLVAVDDATGEPIERAALHVEALGRSCGSNSEGIVLCAAVPPGRRRAVLRAEAHADKKLHFEMPLDGDVDLGTVRMGTHAPEAYFRVVDPSDAPVAPVSFELVLLDDGPTDGPPQRTTCFASSNVLARKDNGANLHFTDVEVGRYLLRCISPSSDAAPRIVEPDELSTPPRATLIAEIVVRSANAASFVVEPPLTKGTQIVIESPDGFPLRELDVDDYGVAATSLIAGSYRLHLVEYGRATSAIDVKVDSNPFVFEIRR